MASTEVVCQFRAGAARVLNGIDRSLAQSIIRGLCGSFLLSRRVCMHFRCATERAPMSTCALRLRQRSRPAVPKIRTDVLNPMKRIVAKRTRRSARSWPGSTAMNSNVARTLMVLVSVAGFSGCQSGPRWAWWKNEKAPDSSVVARSAQPALPSAQSTPQAVAIAGVTPAAPPSSTNLAAAGAMPAAAPAVPPVSIPVTSNPTVANAPLANYPASNPANTLADKLTAAPSAAIKPTNAPPAAPAVPAATASQLVAAVPPSGPYDPKGYKPSANLTSTGTAAAAAPAAEPDRYGMDTADRYAAAPPTNFSESKASDPADRYTAAAPVAATPAAMPTKPVSEAPIPAKAAAASPPIAAQSPAAIATQPPAAMPQPLVPLAAAPSSSPAAAVSPPAPSAPSGVHLTSAPGQYRPGGTSSYPGSAAMPAVEIASRPSPPATSAAPVQPAPPSTSEPWSPPTAPLAPATRTY